MAGFQKIFRLTQEENERLSKLIAYAYQAGYLKEMKLQEFMIFSINCAEIQLQHHYKTNKGSVTPKTPAEPATPRRTKFLG